MAWKIYCLDQDDNRQQLSVPSVVEAIALAIQLLSDGFIIETIQADTGMKLTSRDVKHLCDAR